MAHAGEQLPIPLLSTAIAPSVPLPSGFVDASAPGMMVVGEEPPHAKSAGKIRTTMDRMWSLI